MRMNGRPFHEPRLRAPGATLALLGAILVLLVSIATVPAPGPSTHAPISIASTSSPGAVHGAALPSAVTLWRIRVTEVGLPSGTSWYATANGTTKHTTASLITFQVPNGTYQWSIINVSGYTVDPDGGSVTVHNANVTVSVTFTSTSHDGGGLLSKYWWALAAGGVLLLLIIAVLVIRWRRRQSPPAAEWTPPDASGNELPPPPPEGTEAPYAETPAPPPTSGPSP